MNRASDHCAKETPPARSRAWVIVLAWVFTVIAAIVLLVTLSVGCLVMWVRANIAERRTAIMLRWWRWKLRRQVRRNLKRIDALKEPAP